MRTLHDIMIEYSKTEKEHISCLVQPFMTKILLIFTMSDLATGGGERYFDGPGG